MGYFESQAASCPRRNSIGTHSSAHNRCAHLHSVKIKTSQYTQPASEWNLCAKYNQLNSITIKLFSLFQRVIFDVVVSIIIYFYSQSLLYSDYHLNNVRRRLLNTIYNIIYLYIILDIIFFFWMRTSSLKTQQQPLM